MVLNLLEYLVKERDYLSSLSLNESAWEVRLRNASALIAVFLEHNLRSFIQDSGPVVQRSAACDKFKEFKTQILNLEGAAKIQFDTRLGDMRRALQ